MEFKQLVMKATQQEFRRFDSPKEKAKYLIDGYWEIFPTYSPSDTDLLSTENKSYHLAKELSLMCVREILKDYKEKGRDTIYGQGEYCENTQYSFWKSVEEEIIKFQ